MEQDTLEKQWLGLALTYADIPAVAMEILNELFAFYNSEGRYYHNLGHIAQLIKNAEVFKDSLNDYNSVRFAIWFHDSVYSPMGSNNEELSADFAQKHLSRLLVPEEIIQRVVYLIKATSNHMDQQNSDQDTAYFLDFDLATLGGTNESYQEYRNQIRKEYQMIPDIIYKPGRKKILQRFLDSDRIYQTTEFFALYEKQARLNIAFELQTL